MEETKKSSSKNISHKIKRIGVFLFRGIIIISGIVALISLFSLLFDKYETHKKLTYMTSDQCIEHGYRGFQLCEAVDGSPYLRKIDFREERISISQIVDDLDWDSHRYLYGAYWIVDCEGGLQVETNKSFSDGSPMTLRCNDKGSGFLDKSNRSQLEYSFVTQIKTDVHMNFGGFRINHKYSKEDYSPLLRYHTLNNQEIEMQRKARLEKEAKEKQAKLEKEAKERKARMEKEAKERQVKLAMAKSCREKNKVKKEIFDVRLENAKKAMFKKASVWHKCETQVKGYSNWCNRYQFNIYNTTEFPIKKVRIGDEKFHTCSASPSRISVIKASIPPNTIHTALVERFISDGAFCTKLLDVEFDAKFVPFDC